MLLTGRIQQFHVYSMSNAMTEQPRTIIEELIKCLQWYVDEDEVIEGEAKGVNWDEENAYWIEGKNKAIKAIAWARLTLEEYSSVVESEQINPWKGELIDALVCCHILEEEHYSDPKKALWDLVDWEVQLAVDPRVSNKALQKPISRDERLPEEDDCLAKVGYCWWYDRHQEAWLLCDALACDPEQFTHWLPYWALPDPSSVNFIG